MTRRRGRKHKKLLDDLKDRRGYSLFKVRHPRCVSNKSNYLVYAYIFKHNCVLGGMVFTICKAQPDVSTTNVGHLQVVQFKLINQLYMHL